MSIADLIKTMETEIKQLYIVHGRTIGETQKALTDLKYRLEHGMYINNARRTFDEWFNTWMEDYKRIR